MEAKKKKEGLPPSAGKMDGKKMEKKAVKEGSVESQLRFFDVVLFPLISEKSINLIEKENKIVFVVKKSVNKHQVREAVEKMYGVKVDAVNVLNDRKGRKKCMVQINKGFKADEIATKLGVI